MTVDELVLVLNYFYNGRWALRGDNYEGLEWFGDEPKPSFEELQSALPEALRAKDLKNAERARRNSFATLADPLFFKWQRGEVTEQEWREAVETIRNKYPYPTPPGE